MKMRKALVVLSGGQDSTTCLYYAMRHAEQVIALTFDYGQRHAVEVDAAIEIAVLAKVHHEVVELLGNVLTGTSPLVNPNEKLEQYADADALPGGIEKTFVPMRNALFLTIAANRAVVHGCDVIVTGISQEDYGGYPDCRDTFIVAMQAMINYAIGESAPVPRLYAPLLRLNKADTVRMALTLPGCMDALALSHTCYKGVFPPCGTCHACLLRARGFQQAGVLDPLMVRANHVR